MMNYLTGSDGFSIVLYGEDAYAPEELEQYGLPKELSKQEILDIASMRYKLNTNSFQKIYGCYHCHKCKRKHSGCGYGKSKSASGN